MLDFLKRLFSGQKPEQATPEAPQQELPKVISVTPLIITARTEAKVEEKV